MLTRSAFLRPAVSAVALGVILLVPVRAVDREGHVHDHGTSAMTPDPVCVLRASPVAEHTFVPADTSTGDLRMAAVTATFIVNYNGFTPQAQAAFQYAVDIWASRVVSTVPIVVNATFQVLSPGVLGSAGPSLLLRDFAGAPMAGTWYPVAVANARAGLDLSPSTADLNANFNSNFGWYYGTDGQAPAGSYDFVTVVLHEIGHGLGFLGSGTVDGSGLGRWGYGTQFPGIWDRWVVNGSWQPFLDTTLFPNPSFALAGQLTGQSLYFAGPFTQAAHGGVSARLYAPPSFQNGSSYSHLNEATYPAGNPHSLMTPLLGSAEAIHDPGAVVLGMFRDMGMTTSAGCAAVLSATSGSFSSAGGSGSFTMATESACGWTAASNGPWVTITSATSGTGSTTVTFTVGANPSSIARSARITIAGQVFTVQQAGAPCNLTVNPSSDYVDAADGTRALQVTAGAADCAWAVATGTPWLTPVTTQGTGSRSTSYTAAPNPGTTQRVGTIVVGAVAVTIVQRPRVARPYLDLTGSGLGDILLYDHSGGAYSVRRSVPGSFATIASGGWAPGWIIRKARWNQDSLDDLFFYHPTSGLWFMATNLGGGNFSFFGHQWAAGWVPTVIDFDGDGLTDVFLYNPGTGQWFRCRTVASGVDFVYTSGAWAAGWTVHPADFDGDGRGDLFIYNTRSSADPNSGKWFRVMSGASGAFTYVAHDVAWANDWQVTTGDFTGDGRTDLFLYRPNGQWFHVTFSQTGSTYLGGVWAPNWTLSPGDFDGDQRTDLHLYDRASGQWFVALTRDGGFDYYSGAWAPGWDIAVADLTNDGRSDLVLYNPANGTWFQAITTAPGAFNYHTGTWPLGMTMVSD